MSIGESVKRGRGRPRDESIEPKVLDAARTLLVEVGFESTSLQAIASRAGVNPSAVYRRWPSKSHIIAEAVFPGLAPSTTAPTGVLERDLNRFVRAYAAALGSPVARAAMPYLLAGYQEAGDRTTDWHAVSARPQFRAILDAAGVRPAGARLDADDLFDTIEGALMARALVPTVVARKRPLARLVEQIMRSLEPDEKQA